MMNFIKNVVVSFFLLSASSTVSQTDAHASLVFPKSRNILATEQGILMYNDYNALNNLNPDFATKTSSVCGSVQVRPELDMDDYFFGSQATHHAGSTIKVDIEVEAYHSGHFEFSLCRRDLTSQACFGQNLLKVVNDNRWGTEALWEDYPHRAMLPPARIMTAGFHSYQVELPENLSTGAYVFKMTYVTANSCHPVGYPDYIPPASWGHIDFQSWDECGDVYSVPPPYYELFHNCVDITINGSNDEPPSGGDDEDDVYMLPISQNGACGESQGTRCHPGLCCSQYGYCGSSDSYCGLSCQPEYGDCYKDSSPPNATPTKSPIQSPDPTPSPTSTPTSEPTKSPVQAPSPNFPTGTCGFGSVGDGICKDGSCCSQWGWCGTSDNHCAGETPCGGGNVGNGVCADSNLCCSEYGYCGSSSAHCGGVTPSPVSSPNLRPTTPSAPSPSPPSTPGNSDENSRLIAYIGNWQACPTRAQWEQYTHIVISFAVSYTWSPSKNICSATCDIAQPPVCNNAANPELIQEWKSAGKKVLLSFGGAGMGGSWAGDVNDCWEYCFGREEQVVNRLVDLVNEMGVDGIDLDYEYFYEDNQNFSGFDKGMQAQTFLSEVTRGLSENLPSGSIITHAPMDADLVPGTGYYNILKNQASLLDFLMPQYYNGITRPGTDFAGALDHYRTLTDDMFGGDPTKVVFGFCISDCSGTGSNLNRDQAALVLSQLQDTYSCNGGAFFWVAKHDVDGAWSKGVNTALQQNQCN